MDLSKLKILNQRIKESKRRRPELPKRLHETLCKEAKIAAFSLKNSPAKMQEFLQKLSEPGYDPNILERYILKDLL